MKLAKKQCKSCPFLPDGLPINSNEMSRIQQYLIEGTNHLCHSDCTSKTICKGGRQWQLEIWYRMGRIQAPTHEALVKAMRATGVEPAKHIRDERECGLDFPSTLQVSSPARN